MFSKWYFYPLVLLLLNYAKEISGQQLVFGNDVVHNIIQNLSSPRAASVSSNCTRHLDLALRSIKQEWALKMFDASSKIPSGLLAGNLADLGAYDECLAIEHKTENETIKGKYCMISMPLKVLLQVSKRTTRGRGVINLASAAPKLTLALCIPNSCSTKDLENFFANEPFIKNLQITTSNCQTNEAEPFTAGDWSVLAFLCLVALIMIASTIYDLHLNYYEKDPRHIIFVAFSFYTNGKKLFKTTRNSNQLLCLHGVRFISMMWVIIGHTYYSTFFSPTTNAVYTSQWFEKVSSMYILNAPVSVDSFFVLGGLLMSYVYLGTVEKGIKINILTYYIHRYIRLTPILAVTMIVHMTLLRHLGSGPYWPEISDMLSVSCNKYWWSLLLYVQNYVNPRNVCVGQTWYLSVDMQVFILSPLILIPLSKWPKRTVQGLIFLVFVSMVIPFVVAYENELSGLMVTASSNLNYNRIYYMNTYARFGPIIVGLLAGYFIHMRKKHSEAFTSIFHNSYFILITWAITIGSLLAVVFGAYSMTTHDYDRIESSIFTGVHRVAWSIALSWVIYMCVTGHGGFIDKFLSLPIFQILSRLTYSMYLLHLSIQFLKIGYLRVPAHFGDAEMMYTFWGDFMLTAVVAVFWTLAFESPILIIEKLIFGNQKKKKSEGEA